MHFWVSPIRFPFPDQQVTRFWVLQVKMEAVREQNNISEDR